MSSTSSRDFSTAANREAAKLVDEAHRYVTALVSRELRRELRPSGAGFTAEGLARLRAALAGPVESGAIPGLVALVDRGGDTHVEALGTLHAGGGEPMHRDTVFRMASATKPVTAAAVMTLVDECRLRLDDPVDPWLPELADRQVLRSLAGPVDDTVPARRAITVRDLLTFTFGFGVLMAGPDVPIQAAVQRSGLYGDGAFPSGDPDEWMRRLGSLPLMYQPGERWLYNTGSDVLGVLIARVTGRSFGSYLRERLFEPLGMKDSGFWVPEDRIHRLPTSYAHDPATRELTVYDPAADGRFSRPQEFEVGGSGLVSTADDYRVFCRMLLDQGMGPAGRVLSRQAVELMTTDQLTPDQKTEKDRFPELFGDHGGFGFGMGVRTRRRGYANTGQFGWDGGLGTSVQMDPVEDLTLILLTQTAMDTMDSPRLVRDFHTMAYRALDA